MLKTLGFVKSDLPEIATNILEAALECCEKNSKRDGPP
jgi:hypothetical protein